MIGRIRCSAVQANKTRVMSAPSSASTTVKRHALRGPRAKLPEGDVSAVRRVIEAAASVALHKDRLRISTRVSRIAFPFLPCSARTVAGACEKLYPLQPIERFFHHGHAGFHRRVDEARRRVR